MQLSLQKQFPITGAIYVLIVVSVNTQNVTILKTGVDTSLRGIRATARRMSKLRPARASRTLYYHDDDERARVVPLLSPPTVCLSFVARVHALVEMHHDT